MGFIGKKTKNKPFVPQPKWFRDYYNARKGEIERAFSNNEISYATFELRLANEVRLPQANGIIPDGYDINGKAIE